MDRKGGCLRDVWLFDVIQDILSNLRTFGLRDVIDIAVVSLAMYQIFLFARNPVLGSWCAVCCCCWCFMRWRM